MTIRLVVFDMAGTTVKDNDDVSKALIAAFAQVGIPIGLTETNPVMGYPKPVAVRLLLQEHWPDAAQITPELVAKVHTLYLQAMIRFYQTDPDVQEAAGASETFAALKKQGIRVALDTGFDRATADVLLNRLGWQKHGLIDTSVTSDEVQQGRPYPDMIFEAMRRTGVDQVAQVAKVGDTPSDLQQGSCAGCRYVIGVTRGSHSAAALAQEPHTHLIEHLPELLAILTEENEFTFSQD
ncbi:MAG: HAD hydrolase-like protein [Thermostichus sp. BF3_bins_97]